MWKRYVLPCALVIVVAAGVAVATYNLTNVTYVATGTFDVSLPTTTSIQANPSTLDFQVRQSASVVGQVSRSDIYRVPAQALGLDPALLASESIVAQVPNTTNFVLTVTDAQPARAADMANRLTAEFVTRVIATQQGARDADVAALQRGIAGLQSSVTAIEATPPAQRLAADQSFLEAQKKAINADQQLLASALALPPDRVVVVTRSPGGVRQNNRDLTRNFLVAGAAALLACFIIVVIGEIARDSRSGEDL